MSDLSLKMCDALKAIRICRAAWMSTEMNFYDDEVFVHWRTAEALERRGLVSYDDALNIYITDAGLVALTEEGSE